MSLARDITTVGGGTLLSRVLAYARDAAIAALLGTGPFSEAFFAVLQLVNFFRRLLAEGALNSAFVPLWLRLRAGEDGTRQCRPLHGADAGDPRHHHRHRRAGVVVAAPAIVAVIAHGFDTERRHLAILYLLLVAPYITLAGLIAVFSAALNAETRVAAVTVSTVTFNLVLVGVLAFVLVQPVPLFYVPIWLSISIVSAALIQLMITSGGLARDRASFPARACAHARPEPAVLQARLARPDRRRHAATQTDRGNRTGVVLAGGGVLALLRQPALRIAARRCFRRHRRGDRAAHCGKRAWRRRRGLRSAQSRAYEIALGLALPAATGFALVAEQIAGGLFEHGVFSGGDTKAVAVALTAICSGLPGHVLEKVFGAVSFAHEDTHTPMAAALTGLAAAVLGGIVLFPAFGYIGVAAAIAFSGWVGAGLLGFVLHRRGWLRLDRDAKRRLPRIALATALMGGAVAAALSTTEWLLPDLAASALGRLELLFVLVAVGMLVYGAAIDLLRVIKLRELAAAVRQRA